MESILFRRCRLEKDDCDDVGGNKIGAMPVACEACGVICRNFDWRIAVRRWSNVDVFGGPVAHLHLTHS